MRHCPGDRRRVWACSSETAEGAAACLHRLGGRPRRGRFSEATHCGWRFGIPIAAPDSQPGQRAVVSARICPLPRSRPIHWAPAECVAAPQTGGRGGLCFLSPRDVDSLVSFLLSLAVDSGPVGDQVRTFIGADNIAATVQSVRERIGALAVPSEYEHRHSRGQEVGTKLDFIVDAVERWVLPHDPQAALDLLVAMFEADAVAMENCGEHDWEVSCAYERAAGVIAQAAKRLPGAQVAERIHALIGADGYGVRARLASIISEA